MFYYAHWTQILSYSVLQNNNGNQFLSSASKYIILPKYKLINFMYLIEKRICQAIK